jgi:hypothetical protein
LGERQIAGLKFGFAYNRTGTQMGVFITIDVYKTLIVGDPFTAWVLKLEAQREPCLG